MPPKKSLPLLVMPAPQVGAKKQEEVVVLRLPMEEEGVSRLAVEEELALRLAVVVSRLAVGEECVARWTEDGLWYNGRVEEVEETRALVLFTDYGNKEYADWDQVSQPASIATTLATSNFTTRLFGMSAPCPLTPSATTWSVWLWRRSPPSPWTCSSSARLAAECLRPGSS